MAESSGSMMELDEGNGDDTVNALDKDGATPLHNASLGSDVEVLQQLFNRGANVNAVDNDGSTPLHWAAAVVGHVDVIQLLLNHGANVNAVDSEGATPLHKAAGNDECDVDVIKLLIGHGANVNAVSNLGNTPLHNAAYGGHVDCIKLLFISGANIKARNRDGKTPYQTAIEGKHKESAEYLRNADDEEDKELMSSSEDIDEDDYRRAYSKALNEGEAKNNRIPIMLIGQDRPGKTSLMTRLQGLPFNKDQPSSTGIDVNVIELTKQNAQNPWLNREVKEFMTSEGEAETMKYQIAAEYVVQRKLERDAPVKPVKSLPITPFSTEVISKIKSHISTPHNQKDVLRVFLTDFAGQSIYYDTHGCFLKPHSPCVLVYDLSLEFDKPAVPRFRASEEEEEEMNNPYAITNLDKFVSWLKFLRGLGVCQDKDLCDKSGTYITRGDDQFHLPPVLIAFTHCDKVEDNYIHDVQRKIQKVLSAERYCNVFPEFFLINNTLEDDEGDDVRKLRRKLFDVSKAVLEQEKPISIKWLNFEVALRKKLSAGYKYISVDEAKKVAEDCGVRNFDQAIKYLHCLGAVVYHSGSSKVVLDPHWLMNRFTKVISMPGKLDALSRHALEVFKKKGILFQEYLKTLKDAELLEELMQKFNLISPCQYEGKAAFYVPSVGPSMMSGEELEPSTIPSLFVTFPRQLVPMSLFTKLQVRIISEWKERFPNQQARPSFYCNYSLIPLILDGDMYRVRLIDLHEFVKVTIFPLKNGDDSTFVSHFLAILKKCLNDLKSPDQLLFSMTSYNLEVKCTCCFGKEKRKCSRHHKIQCDSDRCGHRHFWKLSELQRWYDNRSPAVCLPLCGEFDTESVQIWLSTGNSERDAATEDSSQRGLSIEKQGRTSSLDTISSQEPQTKRMKPNRQGTSEMLPDVPMVEGSSHSRLSDENEEKASCSGLQSSNLKRPINDTISSQEAQTKRMKPNRQGTSEMLPDVPMVEGSSHCRLSDENVEKASCSGLNSSKRKRSKSESTSLQEPPEKRNKPPLPVNMCKTCKSKKETPLSSDRNKWPVDMIEYSCFYEICELLDLATKSNKPLMVALSGFSQREVASIEMKYEGNGGKGIAKEVLGKWGSRDKENNVGVLKNILKDIMQRVDVLDVIEKWENMFNCHGCGIKWNPQ